VLLTHERIVSLKLYVSNLKNSSYELPECHRSKFESTSSNDQLPFILFGRQFPFPELKISIKDRDSGILGTIEIHCVRHKGSLRTRYLVVSSLKLLEKLLTSGLRESLSSLATKPQADINPSVFTCSPSLSLLAPATGSVVRPTSKRTLLTAGVHRSVH